MCGFVGVLYSDATRNAERSDVQRATDRLVHRGPDDEGYFCAGPLALGFRRLSILDMSAAGHQPMVTEDGDYALVFNGEIYNFIELRDDLRARGHAFRTQTDTEVILAAYREWGLACFERFNGMWSMLLWDARRRHLLASRDRFGIKPLYVAALDDRWIFASELQAVLSYSGASRALDLTTLVDFVDYGFTDHNQETFVQGVRRFPAGHAGLYKPTTGGAARASWPMTMRYYGLDGAIDHDRRARILADPTGREEARLVEEFRAALVDAVQLRMRSDVPVGTCLSGGVDSGGITCATAAVALKERAQSCRYAFTALFEEYDETAQIRAVVEHTGVSWFAPPMDDDAVRRVTETFFRAHDEPVHSLSPFAGYLVFEAAAREHVVVLLNGQGADELLAGYSSYIDEYIVDSGVESGPRAMARAFTSEARAGTLGVRNLAFRTATRLAARTMPGLALAVRKRSSARSFIRGSVRRALARPSVDQSPISVRSLDDALLTSISASPLPLYLRLEDRNSMAHSTEARLPFLDPRVVELALTAPAGMKRRDGYNKYLERRAFEGLLPDVVRLHRPKLGFPVPHGRWLRGPMREFFLDILSESSLRARGVYDVDGILARRDAMLSGSGAEVDPILVRLMAFEACARTHYDRV